MNFKLKIWRQKNSPRPAANLSITKSATFRRTLRFSKCSIFLTKICSELARNPSRSTLIAGKGFAAPARLRLTVKLTAPIIRVRCASFTCGNFATVKRSPSSRFASARFRSSKIWWSIAVRSTGLSKLAGSSPRAQAQRRRRIRFSFPNTTETWQWKQRRASAAARARRRAQWIGDAFCVCGKIFAPFIFATGRAGT